MAPIFAATGHINYAKASRLMLQLYDEWSVKYPDEVREFFGAGRHTVRYSESAWSGTWSDLSIEESLMRYSKSSGGLSHASMRNDDALDTLLLIATHTADVSQIMETRYEQMRPGYVDKKKHPDEAPSAIRRDRAVIEKLVELMSDIRPFSSDRDPSHLVSLSSGIIDSEGKCDPEKTLEIGEKIQNRLDGKPYTASLERKYVITNLATLKPTVKVGGKKSVMSFNSSRDWL